MTTGSYCSQSSRYSTPTKASKLLDVEPVLEAARKAKENGSTRFCMGTAWRDLAGRKRGFEKILKMVQEVRAMGMEVCTTLGMLSLEQAKQLKEAGLTAYNHNLDTSREFYPKVITTRSYDERLDTIDAVREAGISVCSGGILGLGESDQDRVGLIHEVSNMSEHPESFPVNALVPIPGTPLEDNEPIPFHTLVRTIATARIVLPGTIIRLAAGRNTLSEAEQAVCFMAGANAVFTGEKMLTTPCSPWDEDKAMMGRWGLEGMRSFEHTRLAQEEAPFSFVCNLDSVFADVASSSVARHTTQYAETNARRREVSLGSSRRWAAYGPHHSPFVLNDHNAWYYPSQGFDPETESLNISVSGGNWGKKTMKGCRWVRRGKIAAWGPNMDEWEVKHFHSPLMFLMFLQAEDRARQRIRNLLPIERRSPSPPTLPHLRSPSPPLVAPYPPPVTQHYSFTSFVMDNSVTHSFRSNLLDELEHATNSLIEGEAVMKRALGRLWQVINEDAGRRQQMEEVIPKREEADGNVEEDDLDGRLARSPELAPNAHKLFLSYAQDGPPVLDPSHFASPQMQQDTLEKSLATLRELQDDDREYVERLEEIREGLGDVRSQRNMVWEMIREKAIKEMQDAAHNAALD
ncbi:hypothetical protein J3R82DRAFT_1033 [Butyriboletus roseoflavus]|nr:hypothetical protein J3R82DRAFT_1033 [Butyriboletus roseoflavus]